MRYQAIKQAVDEGLLPESALNQMNLYDDELNGDNANDEERNTVKYNYTLFVYNFLLGYTVCCYIINYKRSTG